MKYLRQYLNLANLTFLFFVITSLGLGIYIRNTLYDIFPIFLTDDTWDYLQATQDIYYHQNFFSDGLRDVRLPGYPIFLALTQTITHLQSNRIVLLQSLVGILSVILGIMTGLILRSKLLAAGLAFFLAVNPIFLLHEHCLLTEAIFLFSLLVFTTLILLSLRWRAGWVMWVLLGLTLSVSILIRANVVFYASVSIAGLGLIELSKEKETIHLWSLKSPSPKRVIGFVAIFLAATLLLLGPWLYRNYTLYGKLTLANLTFRNMVAYKGLHGQLDGSLPTIKEVNDRLGYDKVDSEWLVKISNAYSSNEAEQVSRKIILEQISTNPLDHLEDIGTNFLCFGGYCPNADGEQAVTRLWFKGLVPHPVLLNKNNKNHYKGGNPDFSYIVIKSDSDWLDKWSTAGSTFLEKIRPVLYILFFLSFSLYWIVTTRSKHPDPDNLRRWAIAILGFGYLATAVFHAVMLAGFDRYSTPFDFAALGVILLTGQYLLSLRPSRIKKWRSSQISL